LAVKLTDCRFGQSNVYLFGSVRHTTMVAITWPLSNNVTPSCVSIPHVAEWRLAAATTKGDDRECVAGATAGIRVGIEAYASEGCDDPIGDVLR